MMQFSWTHTHRKKIQEIGLGLFIWESFNFVYDFMFYPFAVALWGLVYGGTIATIGALCINTAVFVAYEYMAIDWLGAHALRELDSAENKTALQKMLTWLGKKKVTLWEKLMSPIVFVALTLPIDPLIVAIHHRHTHFKGISWRDWRIFLAATLAANAWWLLKVGIIVEVARWLWAFFVQS